MSVRADPALAGAVRAAERVGAVLGELVADGGSVLRVGDDAWRVSCRGSDAQAAQRRCESIVKQTSARFQALEIAGRPKNAVRTPTSRLLALGLGLGLGLAWVWLRVRNTSHPSSTPALEQPQRAAATASRVRPKQAFDRTMLGTGPVIDTTAEPARPASSRPERDPMLAPYESTRGWAPDPAISASSTRGELRALCDQLHVLAADSCFVLRVSSDAGSASSKSQIAAQLAWTLAGFGHKRVLLVEADFDDPNVHRAMRLDTPPFKGFSQQLYLRMTRGERVPWSVARCAPCLSVLAELRRSYDILVVDGPPADTTADTRGLDAMADGVVFAVTAGLRASEGSKTAFELFGDKSLLWIVHTHPAERAEQSSHG